MLLDVEACRLRRVVLAKRSFCSCGSEAGIAYPFIDFFAEFSGQIELGTAIFGRHSLQFNHFHPAVLFNKLIDVHVSTADSDHQTAIDDFYLDLSRTKEILAGRQSLNIKRQISLVQMRNEKLVDFIALDGFVFLDYGS